MSGRVAITDYGIDRFNDHCRTSVLRYTDEWERYVTRQARWVDFDDDYKTMDLPYMESVIWAFKQLWDKGLVYEAYRVMPYSWGAETPLSNFEIRLDDATRPRQDPALTVAFTLEPAPGGRRAAGRWPRGDLGLDDHAVDAAVQPGPRRRARRRLRCGRADDGRRAGRAGRCWAPVRRTATRRELGEDHAVLGTLTGADLVGLQLRAAVPLLRRPAATASGSSSDDFVAPTRRHRRRPHGPRLRRGRPAGVRGGRHRARRARSTTRALHRRGPRLRRPERLRRQPGRSSRDLKDRGRRGAPRHLRPQLPALLAHRHADHLQGRVVVVRRGHRLPRPAGRAQPGDQLDPRRTCATASSASGSRAPATGRSPATGSGARPSRCGGSDDPAYPRIDVYGIARRDRARLRRAPDRPAPPLHRRARPAQPRRPDRAAR